MSNNIFKVILICMLIFFLSCTSQLICRSKGMYFFIDKDVLNKAEIKVSQSEYIIYQSKKNCFTCDTLWQVFRNKKRVPKRYGMGSYDIKVCNLSFDIIDSSIIKIDSVKFSDSCSKAIVWFTTRKEGETIFRAISKTDTLESSIKIKDNRIEKMKAIIK